MGGELFYEREWKIFEKSIMLGEGHGGDFEVGGGPLHSKGKLQEKMSMVQTTQSLVGKKKKWGETM